MWGGRVRDFSEHREGTTSDKPQKKCLTKMNILVDNPKLIWQGIIWFTFVTDWRHRRIKFVRHVALMYKWKRSPSCFVRDNSTEFSFPSLLHRKGQFEFFAKEMHKFRNKFPSVWRKWKQVQESVPFTCGFKMRDVFPYNIKYIGTN